jgi:hypothetical protein
VAVIESHQLGRLPTRTADLDDLASPLWMAHDAGVHVEPVRPPRHGAGAAAGMQVTLV